MYRSSAVTNANDGKSMTLCSLAHRSAPSQKEQIR